jgi:hypothetical protein
MTNIRKLTVGSIVGVTLTLGLGGVASAAPVAPTGATATTTPSSPPSSSSAHPHILSGPEIWLIVEPHHRIQCSHAAKEIKRVQKADAAAARRLTHGQTRSANAQKASTTAKKSKAHHAARRVKHSAAKIRGFQKLQSEGQALISRIEKNCAVSGPAT